MQLSPEMMDYFQLCHWLEVWNGLSAKAASLRQHQYELLIFATLIERKNVFVD